MCIVLKYAHRRQQEELCAERQQVDAAHAVARQSLEALRGREAPGAGAGGPEAEARLAQEAEEAMHQVCAHAACHICDMSAAAGQCPPLIRLWGCSA